MDAHFAVSFQIQNLRHPHPRKVPGSTQKWQEGIGVALTFAGTIRPSETDPPRKIGLRTPTVSFHPPLAPGETDSKFQ